MSESGLRGVPALHLPFIIFSPKFISKTQSFSSFSLGYISWTESQLPLLLMLASISKLRLRVNCSMSEPGWDVRDERDAGSREVTSQRFRLYVHFWFGEDHSLLFTNRRGAKSSLSLLLHNTGTGKGEDICVAHPSTLQILEPTLLHPSKSPPQSTGATGCNCMSDTAGRQTGMDLKHLFLTQEKNRLKQMDNKMANSAGTVPGNSSCNRVSLAASCGVLMLLYS